MMAKTTYGFNGTKNMFSNLFKRERTPPDNDLIKPYCQRAREALMGDDLPRAIAFLDCGIKVAPKALELYLQRAQILQYGMNNCSGALRDYRFILRELENHPDDHLASKCRQGMKDMMEMAPT